MVVLGNQADGPFSDTVRLNIVDRQGKLVKNEVIKVPFPSFVHDFFVTQRYIVVPVYPLAFNMEKAMAGCRVKMPVRIPMGFHGTWVGA